MQGMPYRRSYATYVIISKLAVGLQVLPGDHRFNVAVRLAGGNVHVILKLHVPAQDTTIN